MINTEWVIVGILGTAAALVTWYFWPVLQVVL
jgi:hypothetical protein